MRRFPVLAALAALAWGPPAADAATVTSITLYSNAGDFIGQGRHRSFHPGNTTAIGATQEAGVVTAWAIGGPYGETYSFHFRGPDGRLPVPGVYVAADRIPFERPGHPGLDVEGEHRGCDEVTGRFQVLDLDLDRGGHVSRLWVVFHQHCEGDPEPAWGEIRINAWVPQARAKVVPGNVRWPALDAWERAASVPVTYRGGKQVAGVSLAGAHPGDFRLDADRCTGRPGPCDVSVRFVPTAPGPRTALLRFRDSGGRVHESALEGFTHGGVTSADLEITEGDVGSQPGTYHYDPANAQFNGSMSEHGATLFLFGADQNAWNAEFSDPSAPLHLGTYARAESMRGPTPYLDVYGTPARCNPNGGEFTVHDLVPMPGGGLRSADIGFVQDCYPDRRPALIGRWRYRAGAREPLADWLLPGPRRGVDGPPRRVAPRACRGRVPVAARLHQGTTRADTLRGRRGADLILAFAGADSAVGGSRRDCIAGGSGGDRLRGGRGDDVLLGQRGRDVLVGGPGRDLLDCGGGRRDIARVTRGDRTRRCERVRRG